jgi:hypothetical protein
MSKDLFIAAHEELVEEYLEKHPEADWGIAYEATADAAGERYRDKFADMVDSAKQRAKDAGQWPPRERAK